VNNGKPAGNHPTGICYQLLEDTFKKITLKPSDL